MIKIIDGKRYNTETAELVFEYANGHNCGDFQYRSKDLYRTKGGAWFIHHFGGAMTDMSVPCGNNGRGGSSDIEPVSDTDALGFLEAHSDDNAALAAIEKYFADDVVDA